MYGLIITGATVCIVATVSYWRMRVGESPVRVIAKIFPMLLFFQVFYLQVYPVHVGVLWLHMVHLPGKYLFLHAFDD